MEQHTFGYWLRLKRKSLDLTREGLADRVGYSPETVRRVETEERRPSPELVERLAEIFEIPENERPAFLRFARGDWKSAPAASPGISPWRGVPQNTRSSIPATTTSLIARQNEIAQIREYLSQADIRLVTLMGPPGIGKTRLGIESARVVLADFPDGVFFVALAPLDDPNLIAAAIAQGLGFVGAKNISPIEQLKEGIGHKDVLLVLDNCEHLIDGVASLTADLLSVCPQLKILATSRESLRIPGEWLYAVPAFDLPAEPASLDVESASQYPALRLFAERARAVRPDFVLSTENIKIVSTICAHLDGLPLVIELIAARMRLMSPQALWERFNDQFVLTADGMRSASERQKTLHNAIDWSYRLLTPEEQELFAYLSVFAGSFSLETVEAMFSQKITGKPVPHLIALLLDKSLLKIAPLSEASKEARYSMLVTIQEYARQRLQEMGKETEIRNLHLANFLDLAEKADKKLRGHDQLEWLHHLDMTRDDLRAALDWAIESNETETALKMARDLHWYWFVYGDHHEGMQTLARVLEMPEAPAYPDAQAEALTQLAHHTFLQVHHFGLQVEENSVMPLAEKALLIARTHADKHNTARALAMLGLGLTYGENFAAAQSVLEESQALYQEAGDEWGYAHAVMCLGWGFFRQDHPEAALPLYEQALTIFRRLGDRYFTCVTLRGKAAVQSKQNNLPSAVAGLREALIAIQELKSRYEIAITLYWWGEVEKQLRNPSRSVHLFWASRSILDSIGVWTEEDETEFEKDIGPSRAALSETEYATAMQQGRAMTMEQAIAYALEDQE